MADLRVTDTLAIAEHEMTWQAIRAQGAGGQKVNKTESAIHLRFDIRASALPAAVKARLLAKSDQRITDDGVVVIKAQSERSREANLADARGRLAKLVAEAARPAKKRRPTRPSRNAQRKRTDQKKKRGRVKALRGRRGRDDD
tara:strand:+ start:121 stop:549 length:429 start_codon:yes stop_codon:yes gene_type:complete